MRSVARKLLVHHRAGAKTTVQPQIVSIVRGRPAVPVSYNTDPQSLARWRKYFASTTNISKDNYGAQGTRSSQKDRDENEDAYNSQLDNAVGEAKELQARTPWHREGGDMKPAKKMENSKITTKGKFLTTPSRLLKLILPLTMQDDNDDRVSIEPLALLVHPQQPLSYLERLIQSELPMIKGKDGKDKVPDVHFKAEDSAQDDIATSSRSRADRIEAEGSDETMVDGKLVKLGKIEKKEENNVSRESKLRGGPGEGGVESYSGKGREASHSTSDEKFVRWSSSTEIGDFIRDAARGKEFAVEIEGSSREIRVGVPSFNDRTYYLRVRLRKTSRKLANFASVKKECDELAHQSARSLAIGGFAILATWWATIFYFTFRTSYGWSTIEPITYLAGLSTFMIGYLWFLYHNREVSYKAALNLTVSRRQNSLYQARGFDLQKWERLIEEGNALRKEIKQVADEYDVDWDEKIDEGSEEVHEALKEDRDKKKKKRSEEDEEEDEEPPKKKEKD